MKAEIELRRLWRATLRVVAADLGMAELPQGITRSAPPRVEFRAKLAGDALGYYYPGLHLVEMGPAAACDTLVHEFVHAAEQKITGKLHGHLVKGRPYRKRRCEKRAYALQDLDILCFLAEDTLVALLH